MGGSRSEVTRVPTLKFSVAGQVTGLPGRQSSIIQVGGDMRCCQVTGLPCWQSSVSIIGVGGDMCCCQVTGLPGWRSILIREGGDMRCCQVTGLPCRQSSIIRVGGDMGCRVGGLVSYEWEVACVAVK